MRTRIKIGILKYRQAGITLILVLVVALGGGLAWHLFHHGPTTKAQQLNAVLSRVGKLMILPSNESPTLATITDKSKLTDKFLSAKSNNNDRVLIYPKNHMVIIYRPSINKIVAVGNVTGDPALAQAEGSNLTVLDSTNNPTKTQKIIAEIKAAYPNLKVVLIG